MNEFHHVFIPARESRRTLLLLHGTGGNERDLLSLGHAIDEGAALLSPRGQVLENGAPRYFRRLAEGIFDEKDVIARAHELAEFITAAIKRYLIDETALAAIGYSNGANIASAMILLGLARFRRAILLRPMVPLSNSPMTLLRDFQLFLSRGRFDSIASVEQVEALAELFRERGAEVDVQTQESGHELTTADVAAAREWLASTAIA
jgi:phospholipase/carboxylesterase/glyoxalase family protein